MPLDDPDSIYTTEKKIVHVWLTGVECQIRQEGTDEIHGSVGVIVPEDKTCTTHHFPEGAENVNMGPEGLRIAKTESLVYDGHPTDLVLYAILIEHDSGDITEYKKAIAQEMVKAASSLGAAVGVPAEATASSQGFLDKITMGLVDVISDWVGAEDDPYNPTAQRIVGKDILTAYGQVKGYFPEKPNPFFLRQMTRKDSPGIELDYNIPPVVVTGVDAGGDLGRYAFYYLVELFVDDMKVLGRPGE